MLAHSTDAATSTIDGPPIILVALASTIIGILIGSLITRRRQGNDDASTVTVRECNWHRADSWKSLEGQHDSPDAYAVLPIDDVLIPRSQPCCIDAANTTDASKRVLAGALELFCHQWDIDQTVSTTQDVHPGNNMQLQHRRPPQDGKVVKYLKPEDMLARLFFEDAPMPNSSTSNGMTDSLSLRRRRVRSSNADHTTTTDYDDGPDDMSKADVFVNLLSQIQQYSVNTSHPNFFNQLFGAMDPVALASELLALGLNTSAYTYETAPVLTMIEHEVMHRLGRLVFEGKDEEEDDEDEDDGGEIDSDVKLPKYDGQMVPGGSLSNLTALHIARHHWLVTNGYDAPIHTRQESLSKDSEVISPNAPEVDSNFEEKKDDCQGIAAASARLSFPSTLDEDDGADSVPPKLVAFVSTEAHYSFRKAMAVTGIGASNLIAVPTLSNGQMDVSALDEAIRDAKNRGLSPFFVAVTSGSTVRGSFDDIAAIVDVCRGQKGVEYAGNGSAIHRNNIWVHVDGAWGGSAIFSRRPDVRGLLAGVDRADSFTFNPHKMLGAPNQTTALVTRHCGLLKASNSTGARYLFDPRKNGADYDLGDSTYTCGRRPDAMKLWALWKYHGRRGLGKRVDDKVTSLATLSGLIQKHESFMLACEPWPFNINFFYLPPRIKRELQARGIPTNQSRCHILPNDISKDIAKVSVELKLRLHEAGEMIIPFQPLNDQKADCFRLVLAGDKTLNPDEFREILSTMDSYGKFL